MPLSELRDGDDDDDESGDGAVGAMVTGCMDIHHLQLLLLVDGRVLRRCVDAVDIVVYNVVVDYKGCLCQWGAVVVVVVAFVVEGVAGDDPRLIFADARHHLIRRLDDVGLREWKTLAHSNHIDLLSLQHCTWRDNVRVLADDAGRSAGVWMAWQ